MSQVLEPQTSDLETSETPESEAFNSPPDWFSRLSAWNWWHAGAVMVFCVFFLFHNYMRLFYSDIWGHIAYGNWMLDHGELPTEEPFAPLAEGMPMMCTAWLSQVVLALGGRWGGAEAYSAMFAVSITLTYMILARVCYLQTSRLGLSVFAAMLAWGVNWGRHAVIRPEMFGGLCFAILLWLVVRSDPSRRCDARGYDADTVSLADKFLLWLGVPLVFALWANLHGSYIVGFAVLGGYAAGRAIEVLWRERLLSAVLADTAFRRWLLLCELAILATILNPYGFDLLLHTLLFPSNPNLKDIVEWFSLEMVSVEGVAVGLSWLVTLIVFRHSRARIAVSDVILLAVFTLAVCLRVRMVAWYAPVWMLVVAPHFRDLLEQLESTQAGVALSGLRDWADQRSPRIFMFTALGIWLTFTFSPVSTFVLGGNPRSPELQYHGDTPLGVTEYLRENPPEGLVFNPQWWGDWLVWDGPKDLQVMMTTNAVHIVPPKVWRDYLAVSAAQGGFEARLAKYRINTIIVHKELQTDLDRLVRQSLSWKIVYEDDLGLVAVRKSTLSANEQQGLERSEVEGTEVSLHPSMNAGTI